MVLISWKEMEKFVKRYGLPTPKTRFVRSLRGTKSAAQSIGYPVVLKIFSKGGLHKTKIGGVVCDISNEEELIKSYNKISKSIKKAKIKAHGFLIQEQLSGIEVLVGMKQSTFGPAIAFGLGGVFVETLKDFSLKIAPINKKLAHDMIKEIKGYDLLKNNRCNINSIINIITKISKLSIENKDIKEIDFNPVIVNKREAKIVDIRIIK